MSINRITRSSKRPTNEAKYMYYNVFERTRIIKI